MLVWTKDGNQKVLQYVSVPLGETLEGRRLCLASAMDVTQQREFEQVLMQASRQKDEFIAMLGHELRNPLAAVRNATELLKRTPDDAELRQRVQGVLERQTSHMAGLLDGLLDMSRIVQGKIEIERRAVDLDAVVSDVVSDYLERLPDGVTLRCELAGESWVERSAALDSGSG